MSNNEITPIEFEQGDYKTKVSNGEIIVWYKDHEAIEYVVKKKDHYRLCRDDGFDNDLVARVDHYDVCLTVEDISDKEQFRQRVKQFANEVIDLAPDNYLYSIYKELHYEMDNLKWVISHRNKNGL